jgi:hypothetical protein
MKSEPWGIKVSLVETKQVDLPAETQRGGRLEIKESEKTFPIIEFIF